MDKESVMKLMWMLSGWWSEMMEKMEIAVKRHKKQFLYLETYQKPIIVWFKTMDDVMSTLDFIEKNTNFQWINWEKPTGISDSQKEEMDRVIRLNKKWLHISLSSNMIQWRYEDAFEDAVVWVEVNFKDIVSGKFPIIYDKSIAPRDVKEFVRKEFEMPTESKNVIVWIKTEQQLLDVIDKIESDDPKRRALWVDKLSDFDVKDSFIRAWKEVWEDNFSITIDDFVWYNDMSELVEVGIPYNEVDAIDYLWGNFSEDLTASIPDSVSDMFVVDE